MSRPVKSARGVYYDLKQSPYEYINPYGDSFKFSSKKKLEIYTRDIPKEIERVTALLARHDLEVFLPDKQKGMIYRAMYFAFYNSVEVKK